jgi:hypothetical protein
MVSQELIVSIFRLDMVTACKTTRSHDPEDHNLYFHGRENVKHHGASMFGHVEQIFNISDLFFPKC